MLWLPLLGKRPEVQGMQYIRLKITNKNRLLLEA